MTEFNDQDVSKKFAALYKSEPLLIRSPARINLIGEHVDYNNGFVMPAAIDKEIIFAIAPSNNEVSKIYSLNFNEEVEVDVNNPSKIDNPKWANYLLGILKALHNRGLVSKPFKCVMGGNIASGSGLSSSAALECGFMYALNELNNFNVPKLDMIKMSQWAEHNYAGVMCGIMDQFASMMGKENHVFVLDCRSLEYRYFPIELKGYTLVLLDSHVKHSLADSEYNMRRKECEEGVRLLKKIYPDVNSLRDVTISMLEKHKTDFTPIIFKRCHYIVSEIARVQSAATDLAKGDIKSFGDKMYETHKGLSEDYEVSCKELDFLVDQTKKSPEVLGARMMGGGFGGCTINIIKTESVDTFIEQTRKSYYNAFAIEMLSYIVHIKDGTSVIAKKNS